MSTDVTRESVDAALARIVDPCSIATGVPITLADMGLVHDVVISGEQVDVTLCLTSPICLQSMNIISAVQRYVGEIPGVRAVDCHVDATVEWMPEMMATSAQQALRRVRPIPLRAPVHRDR